MDLSIHVSLQLYQASTAFLTGIAAGLFYDFLKTFRLHVKRSGFTWVADSLFWIAVAFGFFWQAMVVGQGSIRIFMLVASSIGATLYFLTLSRFVLTIYGRILARFLRVYRRITTPVFRYLGWQKKNFEEKLKKDFTKWKKQCRMEFTIIRRGRKGKRGELSETQTGKHIYETDRVGTDRVRRNQPNQSARTNRGSKSRTRNSHPSSRKHRRTKRGI